MGESCLTYWRIRDSNFREGGVLFHRKTAVSLSVSSYLFRNSIRDVGWFIIWIKELLNLKLLVYIVLVAHSLLLFFFIHFFIQSRVNGNHQAVHVYHSHSNYKQCSRERFNVSLSIMSQFFGLPHPSVLSFTLAAFHHLTTRLLKDHLLS